MYLARRARKEARKSAAVDGVVLGDDSEGFSSEEDEEASLEEETDAEPSSANLHESAGMSYTPSHRCCIERSPADRLLACHAQAPGCSVVTRLVHSLRCCPACGAGQLSWLVVADRMSSQHAPSTSDVAGLELLYKCGVLLLSCSTLQGCCGCWGLAPLRCPSCRTQRSCRRQHLCTDLPAGVEVSETPFMHPEVLLQC